MEPPLEIKNLVVEFDTLEGIVHAVNGVSLSVDQGQTLGIVGESGCGKTVTVLSLMRLIPQPPGKIVSGQVLYRGQDLMSLDMDQMQQVRGKEIAMVFQDPMTSLNPVLSIGYQISESQIVHFGLTKEEARRRTLELLDMVGIPHAADRFGDYPHQFSGGMRQRVMIAMALACTPSLLIADEPTTALDVTIQAQIIDLVKDLRDQLGMSIIWITHDLGVVAELADRIIVMYAGYIVEETNIFDLFENPRHPYTLSLLKSRNWDLPRSLEGCDWLPTAWDREGCYGGAFMENAVASMPGGGHHTSARAIAETRAADPEPGHGDHGSPDPAAITFRMRDSTDALYPCSIVGEAYLSSCYILQGGMILQRTGFDFARAAAECDRAPEAVRHNCYLSLGTSASGMTVRDTRRVIGYCSHGDPGFQPWCFVGAVKNFVDVTADPEDGFRLCRQVPAGRNRRQCWVAVGEQIMVLHVADRAARERACARAGDDGTEDCRYGASLLSAPPPGLPIRPGDRVP